MFLVEMGTGFVALFLSIETVGISTASAIDELFAFANRVVVMPLGKGSFASEMFISCSGWQ